MKSIERIEPFRAVVRVIQLSNALLLLPLVDNEAVVRVALLTSVSSAARHVTALKLASTPAHIEHERHAVYAHVATALDHARGIAASLRLYHRASSDSILLLTLSEKVEQAITEFWDDAFIADVIVGAYVPPCPRGRP